MPRVTRINTNFASGELSEEVHGRIDVLKYQNGAKTMLNWQPLVQGGVRTAASTTFLRGIMGRSRLEPYEADDTTKFLVVLTDSWIHIVDPADGSLVDYVQSPYGPDDVFQLDYIQQLDTAIITHKSYAPRRLYRDSSNNFYLEDLSDTTNASGIYFDQMPLSQHVLRWYPSRFTEVGDLVQPTRGDAAEGHYFEAQSVSGDQTTGSSEPTWNTGSVGATTTDGNVTWAYVGQVSDLYSWSESKGWPVCCTFHENRLFFAGTKTYPNRVWGSRTGDYFNFDANLGLADDAVDVELLTDSAEIIQWIYSGRTLSFGTAAGEWAVVQSGAITPASFAVSRQSGIGSSRIRPVDIDGALTHVTAGRDQIRELVWDDVEQAYTTRSLSILNTQAVSDVVQIAGQPSVALDSANLIWVVNSDGTVGILNSLRDQDLLSWCRRTGNGISIESVAVLENTAYMILKYPGGPGVFEDGVFEDGVFETGDVEFRALCKVDPSEDVMGDIVVEKVSASPTSTWTGFELFVNAPALEGVLDGWPVGALTVASDGSITTPWEGSMLKVFVPFPTPTLELLPIAIQGVRGNTFFDRKRIVRAFLNVLSMYRCTVGGVELPLIDDSTDLGAETRPSYQGIFEIRMPRQPALDDGRTPQLQITVTTPIHVTLLSVGREVAY